MATSTWRSSLAQVETRLRRSLGLAGPIDLELERPPKLTPVVLSDDATRPGTASTLRGRRWMATVTPGTIAIGNRGSVQLFADPPYGPSGSLSDPYAGGIIVDRMTMSNRQSGGSSLRWVMHAFPSDLVLAPGLPLPATPDNARFVDPTKTGSEVAPVALYGSATIPPETGGGPQISRWVTATGASNFQQELEIFLNWNSALIVGVDPVTVPAAALDVEFTFFGRIF